MDRYNITKANAAPLPTPQRYLPRPVARPVMTVYFLPCCTRRNIEISQRQPHHQHDGTVGTGQTVVGQTGGRISRGEDQSAQDENARRKTDDRRDFKYGNLRT